MDSLFAYVEQLPDASVVEGKEHFEVIVSRNQYKLSVTIPKEVNELFYHVYDSGEEMFNDWSDYYDEPEEELRKELIKNAHSLVKVFNEASDFRVKKDGEILKLTKLECLMPDGWHEMDERIWT